MPLENHYRKTLGYAGEAISLRHYENKGWILLSQNRTEKGSELDLVMQKDKTILFVEVKTVEALKESSISPEDNFTRAKQKHFKRGIELYMHKNSLYSQDLEIRIDLACIYYHRDSGAWSIKTYENIILE